jgi:hypothetical protein
LIYDYFNSYEIAERKPQVKEMTLPMDSQILENYKNIKVLNKNAKYNYKKKQLNLEVS